MIAYHAKDRIKHFYMTRVNDCALTGRMAPEYYRNDKLGPIEATVKSADYMRYEIELGLPAWLAAIEDELFEHVPKPLELPSRILAAIRVGADVEPVYAKLMAWILEQSLTHRMPWDVYAFTDNMRRSFAGETVNAVAQPSQWEWSLPVQLVVASAFDPGLAIHLAVQLIRPKRIENKLIELLAEAV